MQHSEQDKQTKQKRSTDMDNNPIENTIETLEKNY
jgi:hypothetical protein